MYGKFYVWNVLCMENLIPNKYLNILNYAI